MGEGQKVQEDVVFRQGQHLVVLAYGGLIHFMGEYYAFAHAGGAAGVKDVGDVFRAGQGGSPVHFFLMTALEAQFQEVVEINREAVGGMSYHVAVEDDQMFQRARQGENGDDRVVLLLLAYKDEADFSVVDHVFNLRRAAVGEKGNGDGSNAVGSEVHIEVFGHILRKDGNVFLDSDS